MSLPIAASSGRVRPGLGAPPPQHSHRPLLSSALPHPLQPVVLRWDVVCAGVGTLATAGATYVGVLGHQQNTEVRRDEQVKAAVAQAVAQATEAAELKAADTATAKEVAGLKEDVDRRLDMVDRRLDKVDRKLNILIAVVVAVGAKVFLS